MSLPLYIHGCSDVGRQRQQNEDSYRVEPLSGGGQLLVVCDGMGGHEAGEVASAVACQRVAEVVAASEPKEPPRTLYSALTEAHRAVCETAQARDSVGMGTTAVAAWVLGGRCYVGWVGDSRLYHFREGTLLDRTEDHTRVQQMLQRGILTREQAREHPDSHVLTQALGGSPELWQGLRPEVWNEPLELRQGDVLLLCSDGLYDFIEDAELYPLMARQDYQAAAERLVQTANARGGADNITVILLVAGQPQVPEARGAPASQRQQQVPELPATYAEPTAAPSDSSAPPQARRMTVPELPAEYAAPPAVSPTPAPRAPLADASEGLGRRVPLGWALGGAVAGLVLGVGLGWALARGSAASVGVVATALPAPVPVPSPPAVQAPQAPQAAQAPEAAQEPDAGQGSARAGEAPGAGAPEAGVR